jgi:hypothetical protein
MSCLSPRHRYFPYRLALLISMLVILPVGYGVRFAANTWANDFLGSVAYEMLLMVLGAFCFAAVRPIWIALWVCLATCVIEVLQLWQNPGYVAIRATFLGRLILGNRFTWSDFFAYFVGCLAGWAWLQWLYRRWHP